MSGNYILFYFILANSYAWKDDLNYIALIFNILIFILLEYELFYFPYIQCKNTAFIYWDKLLTLSQKYITSKSNKSAIMNCRHFSFCSIMLSNCCGFVVLCAVVIFRFKTCCIDTNSISMQFRFIFEDAVYTMFIEASRLFWGYDVIFCSWWPWTCGCYCRRLLVVAIGTAIIVYCIQKQKRAAWSRQIVIKVNDEEIKPRASTSSAVSVSTTDWMTSRLTLRPCISVRICF